MTENDLETDWISFGKIRLNFDPVFEKFQKS